jgi:hypothetical protein
MARVREFIIAVIVAVEFCNAASVRAGEIPTYLNVNPSATTAAPPSPPTGISPGLANRGSGNNGMVRRSVSNRSTTTGDVTGYRQGGC